MMTSRVPNSNETLENHAFMHQVEWVIAAAPGEGGRGASFASQVPGMRATGRSQVAVKTIP